MIVTRNMVPGYFAPGTTLGSILVCAGTVSNPISQIGWQFGGPVAAGGLVAGLYDVPFAVNTQMVMCVNSSDFTNLFDQYQVRSVTYYLTCSQAATSVLGGGTGATADSMLSQPSIMYFVDKDDYDIPTPNTVRERMGVRSKQLVPGKTVRITVRASKPEGLVYGPSALISGSAIPKGYQWLDTNANNVPHYGLKGIIKGVDLRPRSEPLFQITIEAKVNLALKQVR